jgi:hypothetical protein
MIILKIIKKLLKIHDFNISVKMLFIHIIIKNDFDLKIKNIEYKVISIKTFVIKINVQ